mgnify:CR=1 FL=1
MGDNITASAAVSEATVGVIAELEAENEALKAEIEKLKAENYVLKKTIAELEKASSETSGDKKPVSKPNTKPLFFDHDVISDTGNVIGKYIPKTEAEYERLKPFAVEEK